MNPAGDILSQFAPSFHGFYRAITSIPFAWSLEEWSSLTVHLNSLFSSEIVDALNHLLMDVLRREGDDPESVLFIRTFLSRYISRGRPLNGYFIVCCVVEAHWTILAQALFTKPAPASRKIPEFVEAAAANKAWQRLLTEAVDSSIVGDEAYQQALASTASNAIKCFSSLLTQIEEMEAEPSEDSYAWETMSESLVSLFRYMKYRNCTHKRNRNWSLCVPQRRILWISNCTLEFNCCSAKIRQSPIILYKNQL